MSSTEEVLDFDEPRTDPLDNALQWWEGRRLPFNLAVGLAGAISMTIFATSFYVADIIWIVIYGVIANLAFSFGFLAECLIHHYLGRWFEPTNLRMLFYILGTIGSVILTILCCQLSYSF
ncbi:MAG: hypothetical protein H6608_11900 [Flavobacteriales bacterium]|nr:hypothetical protein [Bacteroidota bacterium]MCB9241832.1 hypothetical protein [Flavobacteriales bacterium]